MRGRGERGWRTTRKDLQRPSGGALSLVPYTGGRQTAAAVAGSHGTVDMFQALLHAFKQGIQLHTGQNADPSGIGLQFLTPQNNTTGRVPPRAVDDTRPPPVEKPPADDDDITVSDDEDLLEKMEGNAAKGPGTQKRPAATLKRPPAANASMRKRPAAANASMRKRPAAANASMLKRPAAAKASATVARASKAEIAYKKAYKHKYNMGKGVPEPRRREHAQRAGQKARAAVLRHK